MFEFHGQILHSTLKKSYMQFIHQNRLKHLRALKSKAEADALLPTVSSMLDKLAKNNVIHSNKAANLKSSLTVYVNGLK